MPQIAANKVIHVGAILNNASSFNANIVVDFVPDEVVIKGISFNPAAPDPGITYLYSNLVNDNIGSFFENFYIKPDLTFKLQTPVRGLYKFEIRDVANVHIPRTGDIIVRMDFVKYKEKGLIK